MKRFLILLGLALGLGSLALAQTTVTQRAVSGNECWNAGQGPGGPSSFLCINTVRNGANITLKSGSGAATSTMTQDQGTLMWTGTAPTTWAVTLPSPAFDGEIVTVGTDTTLTTLVTVTAGGSDTLSATYDSQTIAAGSSVAWQYKLSTTNWYRLR